MTELENRTLEGTLQLYRGDAKRIQHFIKVNAFANIIARGEGVGEDVRERISVAAYVHDIGIHESEKKYGSPDGKYQEKEGPAIAAKLLEECGADKAATARVCEMIAHHHTYTGIDGLDLQILIEADFIVNCYEDDLPKGSVERVLERIFKTESGKRLLRLNFLV